MRLLNLFFQQLYLFVIHLSNPAFGTPAVPPAQKSAVRLSLPFSPSPGSFFLCKYLDIN